jgi:glutamate racemase
VCKRNLPIGVFDSGVGGISVLKACIDVLPHENFLYFGDTKNSPYGNLCEQKITELTLDAVDKLISKDVKAVVIACNTATAAAISALRSKHKVNIIGIEPAIKPACLYTKVGKVLVMLTNAAANQPKFKSLVDRYGSEKIIILPLENLARLIEQNIDNLSKLKSCIFEILCPLKDMDIKAVVLGCTHYLFVKDIIKEFFNDIIIFDGNMGVAQNLKNILTKNNLINDSFKGGKVKFLSSDKKAQKTYKKFWQNILHKEL